MLRPSPIFYLALILIYTTANFSQCHFLLKESYETKPGNIRLSDLGHLSCIESTQRESIQDILDSIGLGGLFPGQPEKQFEKKYLERKWNQFSRGILLHFTGPSLIKLRMQSVAPMDLDLKKSVRERILNQLPEGDYRIEFQNFPRVGQLPAEDLDFEYETNRASRGLIKLKIRHQGRLLRLLSIQYKILARKTVFLAKEALMRGQNLDPHKLSLREQWIEQSIDALPTSYFSDLVNLSLRRNVASGDILRQRDIKLKTLVRMQQKLKGLAQQGGVRIELQVVAKQNGRKGDHIQVESVDTKRKFTAKVIDDGKVKILF